MPMKRCENGHFFDPAKYTTCPYCGVPELDLESTKPRTPFVSGIGKCENGHEYDPAKNKSCPHCDKRPAIPLATNKVVLAYGRENLKEARRLREDLQRGGFSVWWDQDILPGDDWKFEIRKAMKECGAVVLCLSKETEARKKSGIYSEALDAIAIYREQKPGEIFLIPARFSECEIPPIEIDSTRTLNRLQYVDLFPPRKRHVGVNLLAASLVKALSIPELSGTDSQRVAKAKKTKITLTIDRLFNEYEKEDRERLLRSIDELLEIGDITISKMGPGSVKMTLELPQAHAEILYWAIKFGKFKAYDVVDAHLSYDARIILDSHQESTLAGLGGLFSRGQASGGTDETRADGWGEGSFLALPLGTILNRQYRIERVLGAGGFGITYLAQDRRLKVPVAIKEYFPKGVATRTSGSLVAPASSSDKRTYEHGLKRFLTEARTVARLDHHNIVRMVNYFRANGTAYYVMEFLEGNSLAEYLQKRSQPLPVDTALPIIISILDALREVHREGYLHRDVKPHNIYLAGLREGGVRVVLLDFGAARQAIGEYTRSLNVVLTPGYAPLEQYHGRGRQGPWTDVYGVAATFYRMITGRTPPEAVHRIEDRDTLESPRKLGIDISDRVQATLMRALAVRQEERFQSVEAFHRALVSHGGAASTSLDLDLEPGDLPGFPVARKEMVELSKLEEETPPSRFFVSSPTIKARFLEKSLRYTQLGEAFKFYHDRLESEYQALRGRERRTHTLWLISLGLGFTVFIAGSVLLVLGNVVPGAIVAGSTVVMYVFQHTLQRREDHYSALAAKKDEYKEYGFGWIRVMERIDAMERTSERRKARKRVEDHAKELKKTARLPIHTTTNGSN